MPSALALLGGQPVHAGPWPEWPMRGRREEEALRCAAAAGRWGRGPEVDRFERRFAELQGTAHGLCVTSGTAALQIALLALGIEAGDEVLVPAYSFQASGTAVVAVNAAPVFVDVCPDTLTLDPAAAAAAVSPRTKVVMPVHIAGLPAEMDAILRFAARHGLAVLEDACQAHGARYAGRGVGSLGAVGCFSFQASKNLTCGEGGFLATSDADLYERACAIHNCGRGLEDEPVMNGNHRITEFQGAVLNTQLDCLEEQMRRREANAAVLSRRLRAVPGVEPQAWTQGATRHAYHLFSFRLDEQAWGVPRRALISALQAEGVPATEGYTTPLHRMPLFEQRAFGPFAGSRHSSAQPSCPVAERLCAGEGAWLYQKYLLGTARDTSDIADAFEKCWEHRDALRDWWRARE